MTTRGRLDRLARRLDAHVPAIATGGPCRCTGLGGPAALIYLPDNGRAPARPDPAPCPRCGGVPLAVKVYVGFNPEDAI